MKFNNIFSICSLVILVGCSSSSSIPSQQEVIPAYNNTIQGSPFKLSSIDSLECKLTEYKQVRLLTADDIYKTFELPFFVCSGTFNFDHGRSKEVKFEGIRNPDNDFVVTYASNHI